MHTIHYVNIRLTKAFQCVVEYVCHCFLLCTLSALLSDNQLFNHDTFQTIGEAR